MDKRERMARDKRARARAGRVERVLKRRKALDTARAAELERRKMQQSALADIAAGRYPGSFNEEPADSTTTAQGEAAT